MQKKRDLLAIEYLQQNVYPELHKALIQVRKYRNIKLIEYVVKTEEVRKHQERLKKIKIFDKIEQKKVEKDRLKAELGSEYESSDNSMDLEDMGINQSELDKYMGKEKDEPRTSIENQEMEDQMNSQDAKKDTLLSLGEIREDAEDEDPPELNELEQMKEYLKKQREQMSYNPLIHLANIIREVVAKNPM